jgi:hypothetical protein
MIRTGFHALTAVAWAAFVLPLFCFPESPSAQALNGRPDLDIAADSPARETLRRIQTRTGALLPAQAFPQAGSALGRYLEGKRLRSADSAALLFSLPGLRREAVLWSDSVRGHSLFLSPAVELGWHGETHADSNDGARLAGLGGSLYGRVAPRLSYFTRGMIYTEYTDKAQFTHQFNPEFGETYSVEKGSGDSLLMDRTFNRFECYLLAELPWGFTLKAGRDRVHTGPGYFSSLMATKDTPPYWLLEARLEFADWLSMDNYLLRMTDTRHGIEKFANLHRFEFRPLRGLSVAFQDIVIYQDRGPDARYALPLAPLTFTESDMGGPDNSAMGFDFLYSGIRNLSFWGELFIDDLLGPSSFYDDFWENRWAGLAGIQVTSPLPRVDADLVVEYGHVEPWTYNGRQPQTSFKHFNAPSASRLGPDSRTLDAQLSYRPFKWLEIRERLDFTDKGLGRPGTLGAIHADSLDGLVKEWLGGPVSERRVWRQDVGLLWSQWLAARLEWSMDFADRERNGIAASLRAVW